MLEYILLGLLMQGSRNGYQMKSFMEQSTSFFFDASLGSIYPALKRMIKKEWVTFMETHENGKYAKVYTITHEGKFRFQRWLQKPPAFNAGSHEHLVKLFFYDYLDHRSKVLIYQHNIKMSEEALRQLDEVKVIAERVSGNDRLKTLEYGIQYQTLIRNFYTELLSEQEYGL